MKIISEFDIDIESFQQQLEEDQQEEDYEYPKNTKETIELLSEMNLTDFSEFLDNYDERFKITKFEFESKAEKQEFEDWLKKKRKGKDSDDDDDDDEDEEED